MNTRIDISKMTNGYYAATGFPKEFIGKRFTVDARKTGLYLEQSSCKTIKHGHFMVSAYGKDKAFGRMVFRSDNAMRHGYYTLEWTRDADGNIIAAISEGGGVSLGYERERQFAPRQRVSKKKAVRGTATKQVEEPRVKRKYVRKPKTVWQKIKKFFA